MDKILFGAEHLIQTQLFEEMIEAWMNELEKECSVDDADAIDSLNITHVIIYEDNIPPQGLQKLNPLAWYRYWRGKRGNLNDFFGHMSDICGQRSK